MKFDLSIATELSAYHKYSNTLLEQQAKVELIEYNKTKEGKKEETRTALQNRSLHLYFTFLADQLNENNLEYEWKGIKGMRMSCNYSGHIVKEFIWRPIQVMLFNKQSTTKLTTKEINEVIDIISNAISHLGITVLFPSYESWANSEIIKQYERK